MAVRQRRAVPNSRSKKIHRDKFSVSFRIQAAVLGVVILLGVLVNNIKFGESAQSTFQQTSWTGQSKGTTEVTTSPWVDFSTTDASDANIDRTSGLRLKYTSSSQSVTTKAAFDAASPLYTKTKSVSGSGDDGSVQLDGDAAWVPLSTQSSLGALTNGSVLAADGSRYLYAVVGGAKTLYRFDTTAASPSWTSLGNYPFTDVSNQGAAMVYANNALYLNNGTGKGIYRYTINANGSGSWSTLGAVKDAYYNFGAGGGLVWNGGNYIYHVSGYYAGPSFEVYSISANTWTKLSNSPVGVADGSAFAYDTVSQALYLGIGGTASIYRFKPVNPNSPALSDSWQQTVYASLPVTLGLGSLFISGPSGSIYALTGGSAGNFLKSASNGSSWATIVPALGAMAKGAGGIYIANSGRFYAFRGGAAELDTWKAMPIAPAFGTYESGAIDFSAARRFTSVQLDSDIPSGTSMTLEVQARQTATSAWSAWSPITITSNSGSLSASDYQGVQYLKFRITLRTNSSTVTPKLRGITFSYANYATSTYLDSSPYKMGTTAQGPAIVQLKWREIIPAASNTTVRLQLRTRSTKDFTDGVSGDKWYGSGNTEGEVFTASNSGCTRTPVSGNEYEVSCNVNATSPLNNSSTSYVQYRVKLDSPDANATPTVTSVSVVYDINASPVVSNVTVVGQDASGLATFTYKVIDNDAADSNFAVGLYYDLGIRLPSSIGSGVGSITVSVPGTAQLSALLPPDGVLLIENEQILYRTISGNQFVIDTASDRGAFQTIATAHNPGGTPLTVWIRATDSEVGNKFNVQSYVNGDVGSSVSCTSKFTPCSKTITWRPALDLTAKVYLSGQNIKVAANDKHAVNSVGGAALVSPATFTLDTIAPQLSATPMRIVGSAVAGTTTGLKSSTKSVALAIESPNVTGDNPLSSTKYSVCDEVTGSGTCGTFSVDASGGVPSGWLALSSFSNLTSCPALSPTLPPLGSGVSCSSFVLAGAGERTVQFAAVDNVGNSKRGSADIIVDQTPPVTPANFSAQDASNQTVGALVYLRWDALTPASVTDASGNGDFAQYLIYRNNRADASSGCSSSATTFCLLTKVTNIVTGTFADSDVAAATSYQYKIIAEDNIGNDSSTLSSATPTSAVTPTPAGQAVAPTPQITNVVLGTPDTSSVKVSWDTTNSVSDASVIYAGTASAPVSFSGYPSQGDPTVTDTHTVTLVGLSADTTYYLQLRSVAPGNDTPGTYPGAGQPDLMFKTKPLPLVERPTITPGSPLVSPNETSAVFKWTTGSSESASDSFVEYGLNSALGSYYGTRATGVVHDVIVPALTSATKYFFRVRSAIPGGGEKAYPTTAPDPEMTPLDFTTLQPTNDTTAPEPTNIQVPSQSVSDTTAIVTWHTLEPAVPFVEFWRVDDPTTHRVLPSTPGDETSSASILLSSLDPDTEYQFIAISRDAAGNSGRSAVQPSFRTSKDPRYTSDPVITTIHNDPAGVSTVTIYFNTDQATTAVVRYSSDTDPTPYSRSQSFPSFVEGEHAVTLLGLTSGTPYVYKVETTNPSGGNASSSNCSGVSDSCSFATNIAQGELPDIIVPSIRVTKDADKANLVTISWETSQAGNSLVEFGQDAVDGVPQYGRTFGFVRDSATIHSVTLPNDLLEGQTYYFRLRTEDRAGQLAVFPVTADLTDTSCNNPNPAASTCKNPTFSTVDTGLVQIGEKISPPVITGVAPLLVTNTKVVIGWTTDKPATSEVFLGTSTLFASDPTASDDTLTTVHAVTIDGLQSSTPYYFAIASVDRNKQRQSDDNKGEAYTFTTNAGTKIGDNQGQQGVQGVVKTDLLPPVISGISVTGITDFGATITWVTNEHATSLVQYGEDTTYGSIFGDSANLTSEHSVTLVGLTGGTQYHFSIIAYDGDGNRAFSSDDTFTTTGEPGKKEETDTEKTDKNKTDKEQNTEKTNDTENADTLTAIEKTIRELSQDKQLSLQKIIELLKDFDETDASKILDTVGLQMVAPPQFVGGAPRVTVTTDSATIHWTTDKPSDSRIAFASDLDYAPTASDPYGIEIGDTETYIRDHEIVISNLTPNTVYHYQVRSRERVGRSARSIDRTFKTLALQPEIKKLAVGKVTENSITLTWRTNVPVKSVISYTNKTTKEELSQGNPQFLTLHSFELKNLNGDTLYTMRVVVEDESGLTSTSEVISARTTKDEKPPVIDQVRTEVSLAGEEGSFAQAIVSWKTDEPSASQIAFEEGITKSDTLANSTELLSELSLSHVMVLGKLRPATVYRFRVLGSDSSGNKAASRDYTLLTPQRKQSVLGIIINNFEQTFGFLRFLGWSP
ncbi:MAG: hypothetical protein WC817_02770 [Patescibacteria group bacterium]|jgi:hypothetical protein